MTEKTRVREELLKSIEETAWLLQELKKAVADAEQVSVALYRNVQFDLTRRSSALVDHQYRIKHAIDLQEADATEPDYAYWARKHWTIYEAAALAAARKPESVQWDEPTPLLEWLQSAVRENRLDEKMRPTDFLDWFDSLGGDSFVPPKLRQAVVAHRTIFTTGTGSRNLLAHEPDADAEAEAEANIRAVTGPAKLAFEATNVLLEFFMRLPETVPIGSDAGPPVSYSDACKVKEHLDSAYGRSPINDAKTIQKHLTHAVLTARRKRERIGGQARGRRK